MKRIEFGEIRVNDLMRKHIEECLDTNWLTAGPKVKQFEKEWAELFGYKHAVAVSSGTTACTACCMALFAYGKTLASVGDEVIIASLSFIATANAVRMASLMPVFVDILPETLNIDETKIEAAITPKTRAIMVANTMGVSCKLDAIKEIADRYGLVFIVDGAESYGNKYKGKFNLEYADMETASVYTGHMVNAGEGGFVSTNNDELADLIRSIRSHGRLPNSLYFSHPNFGGNFKQTDLHASIGLGTTPEFWNNFKIRMGNVVTLTNFFYDNRKWLDYVWISPDLEKFDEDTVPAPHGFSITMKPPYKDYYSLLTDLLDQENISWKRNFGSIPTRHAAFKDFGYKNGDFPNAEYVGDYGCHIGVHRWLEYSDLKRIYQTFWTFFNLVQEHEANK